MRTVTVSTELPAPAKLIWPAVTTPHAFVHVAKGMLRFPAAERIGRPWQVGDDITGLTFLFGVIPFSKHRIRVETIDDEAMSMVSDEEGGIVRTWRHRLTTTPIDDWRCRYEDRIEIDAGALTPVVAAFAAVFYRYRQRRWKRLAGLLRATVDAASRRPAGSPKKGPIGTVPTASGDTEWLREGVMDERRVDRAADRDHSPRR